ncbi:MAG: N-carbamoylputrescine amidase [Oscillospiraceae bacterium]|nr:N-carbamoylputrescine amidase [Oscillospiraceae bacterium]
MRKVTAAAIQMSVPETREKSLDKAEALVRKAASQGAKVILLPELFETKYFCQERRYYYYDLASPVDENPAVKRFLPISEELSAVIPISFYERDVNVLYNSIAILDCGKLLGVYRKTHIPDDHFYQEKFYFTPGNTGFKVWNTSCGTIGVGICWDQWFPEAARSMALMGAELLLYPTAIGSEPILDCDSKGHWQRCMQGHSAANLIPVISANRIGIENVTPDDKNAFQESELKFYGGSFLTDETGKIEACAGADEETVLLREYDLDEIRDFRMSWGVFRDRRPEMYKIISE